MEEYTTSKKVINHKTKQVETRVKRQIVMEDGKVIADSGPQITSKTKEDNKTEESESTGKKVSGDRNMISSARYIAIPGAEEVTEEKFETRNVTREAKHESLQYHDESIKELSGFNVHQKAITSPNELISIEESNEENDEFKPRGKLTHYSSKSQKISDREEVKEISKRDRDGQIITETTRTNHHEEVDNDEVPESEAGPYPMPEASKETYRKIEFRDADEENELRERLKAVHSLPLNSSENLRRNCLTHHDDRVETSRTKAGGNIIKIEMTSSKNPNYHKLQSSNQRITKGSQDKRADTPDNYHKRTTSREQKSHHYEHRQSERKLRSPSPDYHYDCRERTATSHSIEREDASVQASFSESDDSDNERLDKNNNKNEKSTPNRTFFFGDDKDWSYHRKTSSNIDEKRRDRRIGRTREVEVRRSPLPLTSGDLDEGFISSTFENRVYSSVNGKVLDDSSMSDAFHRTYKNAREKEKVKTGFNDFLQRSKSSFEKSQLDHSRRDRLERSHSPTLSTASRSLRPLPIASSYLSPRPADTSEKRYRETIDIGHTSRAHRSSPGGTWSKQDGRRLSPIRIQDSKNNWPEFSPLTSPGEIRNISSPFSDSSDRRTRRY